MNKAGLLLYTYANPLKDNNNARLMRILETLGDSKKFSKVYVLCGYETNQKKEEKLFKTVYVRRFQTVLRNNKTFVIKIFNNILWITKIIYWSLFRSVSVVNFVGTVDLLLLPYFKIVKGAKCFYYADDIATENRLGGITEKIYSLIEGAFIKYCDGIIVVSDGIKKWYEQKYNIKNVHIIWNAPIKEGSHEVYSEYDAKKVFSIKDHELVFGYIGTFTTGRSLEILLEVFSKIEKSKHLVLAGYGELENIVKEKTKQFSNIHYLGSIPWDKVESFTNSIDVGLVLLENVSLNYYYALPTKFFEYLASGKPVIVSDFPDMGKIVEKYNLGWKTAVDEKVIGTLIKGLNSNSIHERKINAKKSKEEFLWIKQEGKLKKIYNK